MLHKTFRGRTVGLWFDQIAKARERARGLDINALAEYAKDRAPRDLSSPDQLADRLSFLRRTVGDEESPTEVLERIIAGSELQDVNYLERGTIAARSVARIIVRDTSGRRVAFGTGFLIAPNVLLTNNHVLPASADCIRSEAQFDYQLDVNGHDVETTTFALEPNRLYFTSKELDFTVVAVRAAPVDGTRSLAEHGHLPLLGITGKVADGEWLTIVQHPNGERKQVCVRENKLIRRTDEALWYTTDTVAGSSGSPVFSNDWLVVALHHCGIPEEVNGRIQTIYGRDYDPNRDKEQDVKWIANEGIRVSRIVDLLQKSLPAEDLLRPVFRLTPAAAVKATMAALSTATSVLQLPTPSPSTEKVPKMSDAAPFPITVTLSVAADGSVVVAGASQVARESLALEASKPSAAKAPAFDLPFNAKYDDRGGFDTKFLSTSASHAVHLPKLNADLLSKAARLLSDDKAYVLDYHGYSLVMNAKRRLAMYSAANVDFGGRFDMSRPPDVWRQDPRISSDHQLTNFYYAGNQFDRGHLTRREDMEYGGSRKAALVSAADTCHWANCTPQHAKFNQGKQLWQGIERYVLEDSIELDQFRVQVITGPVLDEGDPTWQKFPKIQYPVKFWKVVAALTAKGKLFATAYILDQSATIAKYGIEAAREVPFEDFNNYQVPISDVEVMTGLEFLGGPVNKPFSLSTVDPLASTEFKKKQKKSKVAANESATLGAPDGWVPLGGLESIVLPD